MDTPAPKGPVICRECDNEVTEGSGVTVGVRGKPVVLHAHCWENKKESFRARLALRLRHVPPLDSDINADADIFIRSVHPIFSKLAKGYEPDKHGSRILLGPSGAGKSFSAQVLCHRLARRVDSIYWTTATNLVRSVRLWPLGSGECPVVERAKSAQFLVIDEWGPEPSDPDGILWEVINHRDAQKALRLRTLATSGRTETEWKERYGAALTRRLTEPGKLVSVH